MPFNGSGTFTRLRNWVNDAAAGIRIRADYHDSEDDNFANGLSQCITKDGQTTITANLPMSTYRHTGVGAATARTDYARYDQVQDGKTNWADAGGTADAITAVYNPPLTTLVDGQLCNVRAASANATTTPTFAPDGLTARTIVKLGGSALVAGDIVGNGHELVLRYDLSNTRWELLNPQNSFDAGLDYSFTGKVSYPSDGELTIASGAITPTGVRHLVDTESDASTDDLDTISGGVDGQVLIISPANASRDIVIKDGTGNIETPDGQDITLSGLDQIAVLIYNSANSDWNVISKPQSSQITAKPLGNGGLQLSNNVTDSAHDIDITAGYCPSDDGTVNIELTSAFTKLFDATFAEGTGNGGFASGESLPTSGTIHIWVISKADGTTDVFANDNATSGTSPTLPSGFVNKRRIGSLVTDGSANISAFTQKGHEFLKTVVSQDINTTNPGTSAVLSTLSVPAGVQVQANISFSGFDVSASGNTYYLFTSPDQTDSTPSASLSDALVSGGGISFVVNKNIRTNTSGQVRYRQSQSTADHSIFGTTFGWTDYFD